ncbi:hypothetical protein SLEP1_g8748 [Rubroshorea leprosula]|uniref:Uncharacterized protein n=1 Tax=Rubroshorea leprosula TaxID=152421 RepID=A0AAV5IB29_9ROSI|nr:hypothetical protein SLEP1_g8748 [Rubroshorea leprosula]
MTRSYGNERRPDEITTLWLNFASRLETTWKWQFCRGIGY